MSTTHNFRKHPPQPVGATRERRYLLTRRLQVWYRRAENPLISAALRRQARQNAVRIEETLGSLG